MGYIRDLYWTVDVDTQRLENDASGAPIYVGRAAPGTSESSARWQIRRLTYVSSAITEVNFAEGSPAYNFAWSLRATYTYA